MKISVQFEAHSPQEYDHILATLSGPGRSMFHVKHSDEEVPVEPVKGTEAEIPAPVVPPVEAKEPEKPTEIEPPVIEPKIEKPKRGRPKAPVQQPVTEAPVTVHAEPAKQPDPALADHANGVSRKDLLDVFSEYVQRYGANFGYTDVSKLLQQHIGDGVRKASDVPDGALATAIKAIKTAITENPFNRKVDYA